MSLENKSEFAMKVLESCKTPEQHEAAIKWFHKISLRQNAKLAEVLAKSYKKYKKGNV